MNRAMQPGNYTLADLAEIQSRKWTNNSNLFKAYSKLDNNKEKTDIYESLYNTFGEGQRHQRTELPNNKK